MTSRPAIFLALAGAVSLLRGDQVILADGGQLSGEVLAIDADSHIRFQPVVANRTVDLRADRIERITFGKPAAGSTDHDSVVTLVNGDVLPCNVLSIDDTSIRIATSFAGGLTVPRSSVSTAQLGMQARRVIYKGPENLQGWKVQDNWHFEENRLVSDGRGAISRSFKSLPEAYSIRLTLAWARSPQCQIFFCSESDNPSGGATDRYILQIGPGGLDLRRQSTDGGNNQSLAGINRSPEMFPERKIDIEIRVDPRRRLLTLLLDGEMEGVYPDPLPDFPSGRHLIIQSNMPTGDGLRVSDILVREWDAAGERHRSENRGEPTEDALIDHQGQRYSGRLIATKGDGSILLFKSPHSPDPLEIPAARVSTLFFREQEPVPIAEGRFVLTLGGKGSIRGDALMLEENGFGLDHPLLGRLTLKRDAVTVLERAAPPDEEPETDPGE